MSPSIAKGLAALLGWVLSLVGIAVAWYQSASLFSRFASGASAEWWPYLAATMVEGGIIWAGLQLMSKAQGMPGAIAVLLFVANTLVSGVAQVIEALYAQGLTLPVELGLVVTYVLPAAVIVIASMMWIGEIQRSRTMSGEEWGDGDATRIRVLSDQKQKSALPAPGMRALASDGEDVDAVSVPKAKARGRKRG